MPDWKYFCVTYPFNSQPHTRLTDGNVIEKFDSVLSIHSLIRGWPVFPALFHLHPNLSIHSLIRGWPSDMSHILNIRKLSIHSLIRGWPELVALLVLVLVPFNSQPHTRLTDPASGTVNCTNLSIHSLIRGWPSFCFSPFKIVYIFQFTASYEADPF